MKNRSVMQKSFGIFALVVTALIWGLAFSAQRQGAQYLSANVFLAIRSWIGCAALLPVIMVMDYFGNHTVTLWGKQNSPEAKKYLLRGGVICGVIVFTASLLQQLGLHFATAGKSGFLTALYIVIVPVLGLFFKRKTNWLLWIAVAVVLCGSWLLCVKQGSGLNSLDRGDVFLLACAFCYALHIIVADHFVPDTDCVRLSYLQFFITALLATVTAIAAGDPWDASLLRKAAFALLFCGIGSTGIAYTMQLIGQKYVHPVAAALIMSLESVFSVLGGWLFLNEQLTVRELSGCAMILIAVILAQIPLPERKTVQQKT